MVVEIVRTSAELSENVFLGKRAYSARNSAQVLGWLYLRGADSSVRILRSCVIVACRDIHLVVQIRSVLSQFI